VSQDESGNAPGPPQGTLRIDVAVPGDGQAIAAMQTRAADELTARHGPGHWSTPISGHSVERAIESSRVLVAREDAAVVGTLRLVAKKPWAIDTAFFSQVRRPLYLLSMTVDPSRQRAGIGRRLLDEAAAIATTWPADAIRLDAYEGPAGAGPFYERCGYREVGRVTFRSVPLIYYELILP
jgi:GNAT superfamily N-acetyltransferase